MYENEIINQFIHLRSQDFPLRTIAEKIGIPKSTLSDWEKRYYGDIQIARAEAWDQTEEDAAFTPQDDLKALLAIITTCQDELVRRRQSMKTHELIRLMFAARRDYFRRRDAFMKPLNNLRNKAAFHTTLKLADRLKDVLGILPQIEAEREALSKTSPDKTGQTSDKNPDITANPHNDNHLPPDKNPDNTPDELSPLPLEPVADSNVSGNVNDRSPALPLPRAAETQGAGPRGKMGRTKSLAAQDPKLGGGEGQTGSVVSDCDPAPQPADAVHDKVTTDDGRATCPHGALPSEDGVQGSAGAASHDFASTTQGSQAVPSPGGEGQGEGDSNGSAPSHLCVENDRSKMEDDFLGSIVINPLECGQGVLIKWLEHEAAHRARRTASPENRTP